jgi:myo-inositol-1(or 4)-monophosphatase
VLLARYSGPARGLGRKSSETDPVSDADREAERMIARLLADERPEDGVLGEEGASREGRSGRRWVVDPLDGTVSYLYRYPAWCVSVALEDARGPAVGVVHDPLRDETFAGVRGGGATLGGDPLAVRGGDRLEVALIATGFGYEPARRERQAEVVSKVLPSVRDIRRSGAAALDLAWVAAGRLDGYYERGLNRWDWAAGRLLVEEAGGAVAELDGDPPGLVAASRALLPALRALVA